MAVFEFQELKLFYRVSGIGNPVVFLHGFLEDHTMWEGIFPAIENSGFQIIRVDLPCHGQTRFKGDICEMSSMARLMVAFLAELKVKNPFVIGHSMGGYVGLEMAKIMNLKLVLLHSNFWADSPDKQEDRNRVAAVVAKNKARLIQEAIPNLFAEQNREKCRDQISELIARAKKIPSKEIIAATKGMRDRLSNELILKTTEVSIIQGEHDPIINTQDLLEKSATYLSFDNVIVLKNTGHMSIWEQPEMLINCLKSILIK